MERVIRSLTITDYDKIIALWSDAGLPFKPFGRDSREMLEQEMNLPQTAFYGLFDGDQMLGVGMANYDGRRGWVNRVAIHPDYRGEKLAGQLMDKCESFLRSQGAVVICALIEDENAPSISCFHNHGFVCEKKILYFTKRDSATA